VKTFQVLVNYAEAVGLKVILLFTSFIFILTFIYSSRQLSRLRQLVSLKVQ
jgi:hypothetical protein